MMFTRETALALATVYYVELPDGINGITTPDPEHGDFVIAINTKLDDLGRRIALEHELAHIRLGHFYDRTKSDDTKEREADDLATLEALLAYAAGQGIEVDNWPMKGNRRAFALPGGWIAVDYSKFETITELARVIAHEIGHIMTGTFYKADDPAAVKADCERQADEWAATHLIDYMRS